MSFYKQYFTIIGLLILTVVISILLLPSNMILARTATFIDTTSYRASADQTFVRTKMDLGDVEHMMEFPRTIGKWQGSDYEISRIEEALNADVILLRAYQSPSFYQPIFLLVIQSSDLGSFHPPLACYPVLGYQIEEEAKEEITLSNVDWVSYWRSESERRSAISIKVNKLVVFKEVNEKVTERRVVIYFYVKETLVSNDKLTMVRVSALAPIDMSYDGVLSLTKDFTSEVIPYLFEFYEQKEESLAANLAKSGPGWLLMVILFLVPVAIIVYPRGLPKELLFRKRERIAVVEEPLKFTVPPELLAEVENNHRKAIEPWSGKLLSFHTSVYYTMADIVHILPANLRQDLLQAYVDMDLANSIVWLSTELGRRSHNLDESYVKLCTNIAVRLDRIMLLLKR